MVYCSWERNAFQHVPTNRHLKFEVNLSQTVKMLPWTMDDKKSPPKKPQTATWKLQIQNDHEFFTFLSEGCTAHHRTSPLWVLGNFFCPTCLHPSPSWHGPQDVNDVDSMPGDNHRNYPTSKCGQGTTQRLGPRRPRACKKCNFHSSFEIMALLTKPSSRLPNNRKRCRFNSWPFFFSGQPGG